MNRVTSNLSATLSLALALVLGCSRTEAEPKATPEPPPPATAQATATRTTVGEPRAADGSPPGSPPGAVLAVPTGTAPSGPLVLARGIRIVHAGAGSDAAKVVRDERARAKSDGRDLVVYVGAKWCEPCKHFHAAAEQGLLDADFPDLTLLEFDLDEDRDRLATAGYVSDFIPLFAMPAEDGKASDKRFSGSVKGNAAVANISPRLRSLLTR